MPDLGAHLSVAGGFHKAVAAADELTATALQIFTKAPGQWRAKPITDADAAKFREARAASNVRQVIVHDSYLINLASADDALWEKSLAAFVEEIARCAQLGIGDLVSHPGAHLGAGDEAGLSRVAAGLERALSDTAGLPVRVLIETTAGQGTCLGHRFEHLGYLLTKLGRPPRLGVCFDTCHVLAAGYPLDPEPLYRETWADFDALVGVAHLHAFHLNDSVKPVGSRVDRHAGLGKGHVGLAAFERIVTDPRFRDLPMVLETPKEDAADVPQDPINLAILRGMLAGSPAPAITPVVAPTTRATHEPARDPRRPRPRNPRQPRQPDR